MSDQQPTAVETGSAPQPEEAPEPTVVEPEAQQDAAPEVMPPAPEAQGTETEFAEDPTPDVEDAVPTGTSPQPADPAPETEAPRVGPRILGIAPEERPLPIVKQKLREKPPPPKREPLPFPELRTVVGLVREDIDAAALKELFRLLPPKVREEVVDGVREFRKGARRPLSQHAAKSLARAVHTARRQKRSAAAGTEVGEAIAQAIIGELVASLEVELAAEVILPKRDLLDRESRNARRRQRDEEDKRRDEDRKRKREEGKGFRGTSSFGEFAGTKIKGLDEIAAALGMTESEPEEPQAVDGPQPTDEPQANDEPQAVEEPPPAEPEPDHSS